MLYAWLEQVAKFKLSDNLQLVLLPSYVFLSATQQWMSAQDTIAESAFCWGAQNVSDQEKGAYSGEVSAGQLRECGCQYALVGHSERRRDYDEDNAQVGARFARALEGGLTPILCVGETTAEREADKTNEVLAAQLEAAIQRTPAVSGARVVVAYEPVWAIGSNTPATGEQAQTVHSYIRHLWTRIGGVDAERLRIVYGGSVSAKNAATFGAFTDIDGLLVGGASLNAEQFLSIGSTFAAVRLK